MKFIKDVLVIFYFLMMSHTPYFLNAMEHNSPTKYVNESQTIIIENLNKLTADITTTINEVLSDLNASQNYKQPSKNKIKHNFKLIINGNEPGSISSINQLISRINNSTETYEFSSRDNAIIKNAKIVLIYVTNVRAKLNEI